VIGFLLVFCLGAMGFVAGSEMFVRVLVAPTDGFEVYKREFWSARAPIAAFGDSHVANAIKTSATIANLGFPGDTLPLMLAKAEAYARSGRSRKIVLQVSPEQFAIYRADSRQDDLARELLGDSSSPLLFLRPHFRRYLLSYWNAVIHDPGIINRALHPERPVETPSEGSIDPPGFVALSSAEQRRSAEIRVQLHAPLPPSPAVDRLLGRMASTIDEFQRQGIEACLAEYPVSAAYRRAVEQAPTFAQLGSRIAALAKSRGIRLVDLTSAMPDDAFADADHLARRGRDEATRLLLSGCFGEPQVQVAQ
jgi:hypothetical protein